MWLKMTLFSILIIVLARSLHTRFIFQKLIIIHLKKVKFNLKKQF